MKNITHQLRFWVILGPMVMLAAFLIAHFNQSNVYPLLPTAAVAGLFLSWRWKLAGMGASLVLLSGILFYDYPFMSADDRFWQVGLAMAFALACLITSLCSEETESLLKKLELESDSRLEHLRYMDEKLKKMKKMAKHEQEDMQAEIRRTHHHMAEKEGKVGALEEVIAILREELKAMRDKISEPVQDENPSMIEEINEQLQSLKREKELLQTTLGRLQKEISNTR